MRELIHRHQNLLLQDQILIGVLGQAARIYFLRRIT
jgi:hypothetical protein